MRLTATQGCWAQGICFELVRCALEGSAVKYNAAVGDLRGKESDDVRWKTEGRRH